MGAPNKIKKRSTTSRMMLSMDTYML
jgi:hypothetical protein